MIKSIFFNGENKIDKPIELPKLTKVESDDFFKIVNSYSNKEVDQYIFASSLKNIKTSYLEDISKYICPNCNYPNFDNAKNKKIIKCTSCKNEFRLTLKKINVENLISLMKKHKFKNYRIKKLQQMNNPNLTLSQKYSKYLINKKYSLLINNKYIIPPLKFYIGNKYCLNEIKKFLNNVIKTKQTGDVISSDKTVVMPYKIIKKKKVLPKKDVKSTEVTKTNSHKITKQKESKVFLYTKFMHGDMDDRYKGGNTNFFRKHILSKRITNTGRCVIVPAPNIKANEVVLPSKVYEILGRPKAVLLIRYPTLDFQNITFHKVIHVTDKHTVKIPISITKRNGADFDGDEIEIIALDQPKILTECQLLLDPEYNFGSLRKSKISMGQDMTAGFKGLISKNIENIENILYQYYCIEGSKKTFDLFHELENDICTKMWNEIGAGISIRYLIEMQQFDDDITQFDKKLLKTNFSFTWFLVDNTSFHSLHLYQIVKKIGIRKLVHCKSPFIANKQSIDGNLLDGLNIRDFITHCQASRDSLIDSNYGISIEGYNLFKLSFCSKDLVLHYDDSVCTVGKKSKIVARKFQHIYDNTSKPCNLPNFFMYLFCKNITKKIKNKKN